LILLGNTLYGTAYQGGSSGFGTVFAINTNGTSFTNLHSFNYASDGANPQSGLLLIGGTLYGTANSGGNSSVGTVFAVNTDGTSFTNLHNFIFGSDGANPQAGLTLSGNSMYGTAYNGGAFGNGTMFSLSLGTTGSASAPTLIIIPSGANVILKWLTNAVGYTLQAKTNLSPSVNWSNATPAPVIVGIQYTVTNGAGTGNMFYRLEK
jgi:uncharacterized repeat protein (TIGR03803 family)